MDRPLVPAQLVGDGFDLEDTYERPNRYNGTWIKYRPALQDEVQAHSEDRRKLLEKQRDMVVKHLIAWNCADAKGEAMLPLTPESVRSLPYPLLDWMFDVITGYQGSREATDAKNS